MFPLPNLTKQFLASRNLNYDNRRKLKLLLEIGQSSLVSLRCSSRIPAELFQTYVTPRQSPPPPPPQHSLGSCSGCILTEGLALQLACQLRVSGCTDQVVFIPLTCATLLLWHWPCSSAFASFAETAEALANVNQVRTSLWQLWIVPDWAFFFCPLNVFPLGSRRRARWFWHIIICLWSWTGRLQHVRVVTPWFQGWLFWKADGFSWSFFFFQ